MKTSWDASSAHEEIRSMVFHIKQLASLSGWMALKREDLTQASEQPAADAKADQILRHNMKRLFESNCFSQ